MLKGPRSFLAMHTHIPVLVEHPNDPVSEVEDVSPVEVRYVVWTILRWAVVQEVEDVLGRERRVIQTPVNEVHYRWVADGVLKQKRKQGNGVNKDQTKESLRCTVMNVSR